MEVSVLDRSAPLSSAEFDTQQIERLSDVLEKHQRLARFLKAGGYDAALLTDPATIAWFTSGSDCESFCPGGSEPAVFVTADARLVACRNVDSSRVFEREVAGLGFQLKERPWNEPLSKLLEDLCRGRKVAADAHVASCENVAEQLRELRLSLSDLEQQRITEVAKFVTHAVEATGRSLTPGRPEDEIAGEVSHRLWKKGVTPIGLQVCGDGRGRRFRSAMPTSEPVYRSCTLTAWGRKWGLCVGVSRTVVFAPALEPFRSAYEAAAMVAAAAVYFSQPEQSCDFAWQRVERMYEKTGRAEQWRLAEQGAIGGYEPSAVPMRPGCNATFKTGTVVTWTPSVDEARLVETVLVGPDGPQRLCQCEHWPQLHVQVKDTEVLLPDVLVREV